jgi:hypothetical protein
MVCTIFYSLLSTSCADATTYQSAQSFLDIKKMQFHLLAILCKKKIGGQFCDLCLLSLGRAKA